MVCDIIKQSLVMSTYAGACPDDLRRADAVHVVELRAAVEVLGVDLGQNLECVVEASIFNAGVGQGPCDVRPMGRLQLEIWMPFNKTAQKRNTRMKNNFIWGWGGLGVERGFESFELCGWGRTSDNGGPTLALANLRRRANFETGTASPAQLSGTMQWRVHPTMLSASLGRTIITALGPKCFRYKSFSAGSTEVALGPGGAMPISSQAS